MSNKQEKMKMLFILFAAFFAFLLPAAASAEELAPSAAVETQSASLKTEQAELDVQHSRTEDTVSPKEEQVPEQQVETAKPAGAEASKQKQADQAILAKADQQKPAGAKEKAEPASKAAVKTASETGTKKVQILHTNDSHARVKEAEFDGMGFAKLSTLIKQYEAENGEALLLDAGDTLHGTNFATLEEGSSIVEVMNEVGYDAMAAGNHDFNYGYKRLLELKKKTSFPVLSANAIYKDTGKYVLDPYTIKEVNGVKFGIFGLTTPETHFKTHPKNVEGIQFTDPVAAAQKMIKELKGRSVDVIIALTHLGTDASSTDTSLKVARGARGIDLIVDGHSHTVDDIEESGTLIVSAGEYLKNLGVVELTFDSNNKLVSRNASRITKEQAKDIVPDADVAKVIQKIEDAQKTILDQVIGKTDVVLDGEREQVRVGETNLGNLIADAMIDVTGADLAITNGGGIRASIPQGSITKGHVITVLPFGNYIQTLAVPGWAIKESLENGVSDYPNRKGAFPQVGGITFKIDAGKPAGERVHSIKVQGKDLDLNKTYTLATNDFLAAGGDEYTALGKFPTTGDYPALDEALIRYIQKLGDVQVKAEGRIVEAAAGSETPILEEEEAAAEETPNATEEGKTPVEQTEDVDKEKAEGLVAATETTRPQANLEKTRQGALLPETSEDRFMLISAGLLLLAAGGAVRFVQRRRVA